MPARPGLTIADTAKRMDTALGVIRRGATPEAREAAVQDLERAMQDASRIAAVTFDDANVKADMVKVALMGRNARAARRIVASLARDLEHLPKPGALPCR